MRETHEEHPEKCEQKEEVEAGGGSDECPSMGSLKKEQCTLRLMAI